MKKCICILITAIVFMSTGCEKVQEMPQSLSGVESVSFDDTQQKDVTEYDVSALEDYIQSIEEQSSAIRHYLEYDAMTQLDMNMKSQELYQLWDGALNYLWGELQNYLPQDEFTELLEEQRSWIAEKENAISGAGKEYEGGSMYALVVNSEGARITEERVYELLKKFLHK